MLWIAAVAVVLVGQARAEEVDLPPERWPLTVTDAVKDIVGRMTPENKAIVKNTSKSDLIMFHHGWGTSIRNYYGLRRGNRKLVDSACHKPCHPDDASMVIIEAVWTELQK
ncbi:hypothetical protein G7048_02600 [Diaphorobacter sp. HDW4B]|uniref:DUF6794 domain-containing protein n=1 Tax=Diaphorobacter sp. HDW4B TaxID=2714925 RepID=UPI00140C8546|nr:DUF6794 domain-containing protein [Diaphorobacter sp. HDW4B]QIL69367.1 hypothetical protein G7048_02600 [Diaphorobacter sp. HDW4B]